MFPISQKKIYRKTSRCLYKVMRKCIGKFCSRIRCSNERVQIISFKHSLSISITKKKKKKSFTIGRRQSGNSTIRCLLWYNLKYDTLFVMNRRKQISIDVQSFIICLQIMQISFMIFFLSREEEEPFRLDIVRLFTAHTKNYFSSRTSLHNVAGIVV